MDDLENIICPICNSSIFSVIRKYRSNSKLFHKSFLYKCLNCDFVLTNPKPSDEDLFNYNSNYFISAHGGISKNRDSEAFFESMAIIRFKYIKNYSSLNFNDALSILEIGPGNGHLAKYIKNTNLNILYDSVEADRHCHSNLLFNGINVVEYKNIYKQYDLIIMSHVLEHVSNPFTFLDSYKNFLKLNGYFFIEVPCRDWMHKTLDEPHLLFFEKKSLLYLFEKLNMVPIDIAYYGRTIDSLAKKSLLQYFFNFIIKLFIKLHLERLLVIFVKDLDFLPTDLHKLIVNSTCAHIRASQPSWWLRVLLKRNFD
jgi:SAM-dependent methyltransferase